MSWLSFPIMSSYNCQATQLKHLTIAENINKMPVEK